MGLTEEEVATIKATVPVVQQYGNAITKTFYHNLLVENPDLQNIFNITNQKNGKQPQALAGALIAYAANIDNLGALTPAVERICHKHASLNIQPDQYKIVGKYLLAAMGEVLGEALTPDILSAWGAAYWQLANILIGRESEMYSSYEGWTGWRNFKIAKKIVESETITSFYLEPEDGKPLPPFKPGQYVSVQLPVKSFGYLQSRQYSLSDAPRADYYRISVKREVGIPSTTNGVVNGAVIGALNGAVNGEKKEITADGMVSNALHDDTKVGDIIEVTHPAGEFFLDTTSPSQAPIVLISAGVGVTPMISILSSLIESKSSRQVSWIHGARSSSLHAFSRHIQDVVSTHDNIHALIFKSQISEKDVENVDYHHAIRVNLEKAHAEKDLFLSNNDTTYFVCGPEKFMSQTARYLGDVGVGEERIRLEVFGTGNAE